MLLLKTVARSILRRRLRSAVAAGVAALLALFLSIYAGVIQRTEAEIEKVADGIPVTAVVTNSTGVREDMLDIPAAQLDRLMETGFIASAEYALAANYTYTPPESPQAPGSGALYGVSDAAVLAGVGQIDWLDGYSPEAFMEDGAAVVAPARFLEQFGLAPGDELPLRLAQTLPLGSRREPVEFPLTLRVVGSNQGQSTALYCPVTPLRAAAEAAQATLLAGSARFTLQNTSALDQFKAAAKRAGFISATTRETDRLGLRINDRTLIEATEPLRKNAGLMRALYPVILVVAGLVGFVVSYVLTQNRKAEFAVMRSLGGSRAGIFLAFFVENALLAAGGALAGWLLSPLFADAAGTLPYILLLLAFYLAGAAVSVAMLLRTNALQILTASD